MQGAVAQPVMATVVHESFATAAAYPSAFTRTPSGTPMAACAYLNCSRRARPGVTRELSAASVPTFRDTAVPCAPWPRGAAGSRENRPLARINRENSRYRLRPAWWSPEKSKDIVARARSLRVRQSWWHMMAPTRPSTIGTEVSTERWNSSAVPWPVWVNLHRRSLVVSVAMWSVTS